MTPILLLLACAGPGAPDATAPPDPRPPGVPADAVEIRLDPDGVRVADQLVGTSEAMLADPVDGTFEPLVAALSGVEHAFVRVNDDSPWMVVRKLVNSADQAGVDELRLATDDRAWQPPRQARSRWASATCEPGSAPVVGIDEGWTLELHRSADGLWALGSARFRPVVQRDGAPVPHDDLPLACWSGASCELAAPAGRAACADPPPTLPDRVSPPDRVRVAGEWGCLLPLAKAPADLEGWTAELAGLLDAYRIGPDTDVMLIPEANIPFSAIAAVLDAFAAKGQPPPTLGVPLVEGNDGPPLCTTSIRDRAALDAAAGAWLGDRLRAAEGG